MDYNFHTHTVRCGHASGSDEEYVLAAIESGIKVLGFSDHAPFLFPDGRQQAHCVQVDRAIDYVDSINSLKKKYADKIDIHVGFEMEYYPSYFDGMLDYVKKVGAEYLILGEHAIYDGNYFVHGVKDSKEDYCEYVKCVVEAMETKAFTYVAHPDLMQLRYCDGDFEKGAREIARASLRLNIPLEINLLGIREGRCYPTERFWRIAAEEGAPVTVGIDAHSPSAILDKGAFSVAEWFIRKHRLNYVGMPKIVNISK
jgi:histidinol-phosphatase (PHP family)